MGYSQVSHSTSEFDVTGFLWEKDNTLAVLVLKWCGGSYLEDQDKFRMTGIFQAVYLLKRPVEGIFDYFLTTKIEENCAKIQAKFVFFGKPVVVNLSVYDENNRILERKIGIFGQQEKIMIFPTWIYAAVCIPP